MPTRLPVERSTQARPSRHLGGAFNASCASIGVSAAGLASFIGWFCSDTAGAVFISIMAAGVIGVLFRAARRSQGRRHQFEL